ncbi:MAG TPA: DUF2127 domain-containing protein [Thermoanaerobaculia bacterium]|nr:DUF2127 domain-containing protein [Thermoanaerobaculia bacterium]
MLNQKKMSGGFLAIIIFKYFKSVVFLLVGIAALSLSRADPFPTAEEVARFFRSSPENELVKAVSHLTPGWAVGIGVVSLFVGAVFGTEATLLTARVWWSTYFTLVLAVLGIPLEIFEIFRRPSGLRRYLILAVNIVIVVYVWKRRNEFRDSWGRG